MARIQFNVQEDHEDYYQKVEDLVSKRSNALNKVLKRELVNIKPEIVKIIVENCHEKASRWLMNTEGLYFPSNGMINSQIVDKIKISDELLDIFSKFQDSVLYKIEETYEKYEKMEEFHIVPKLQNVIHSPKNQDVKTDDFSSPVQRRDMDNANKFKLNKEK